MKRLALALLALASAALAQPGARAGDYAALTRDVGALDPGGGLPGPVASFGPRAFPVVVARNGGQPLPLFAAARFGRGRVVIGGHESFFAEETLKREGNARFYRNVLTWLAQDRPLGGVRLGVLGVSEAAAREAGANPTPLRRGALAETLRTLQVLSLDQAALDRQAAATSAVVEWVRNGGGLLITGPAWGWLQLNPGKNLATDHSGNRIVREMGLAFTDGTLERGRQGFPMGGALPARGDAGRDLDALAEHGEGRSRLAPGELASATNSVIAAVGALPADDAFSRRVAALCARHGGDALPTREAPVTNAAPFARLKLTLDAVRLRLMPAEEIRAHPAATSFPGAVPAGSARVTRVLRVDLGAPDWRSTGLYAAPGEVVTVKLPPGALRRGLAIRIGAHTDTLWHLNRWERFPEVSRRWLLDSPETRVASAFGGAIYVDVSQRQEGQQVDVTIENAVPAPHFRLGETTVAEWRREIRLRPAPWAELEGRLVTLTVPSSVVRTLDRPQALMTYWDEVMEHCYALYSAPRRPRAERYCVDRQISAGYMHSGYPIMTGDDVAARFCDLAVLRGSNSEPLWGFYHEMGHNFQEGDWTWDGCGEVTNNLFSLYAAEKMNGVTEGAHPGLRPDELRKRMEAHLAAGVPYERWKSDPFLALHLYMQLQKQFGWAAYQKVFAEYRALPAAERPKNDQEKRDQFMQRFSRTVGRNLAPFFRAWGVPLSAGAEAPVKSLPAWLPPELAGRGS